MDNTKTFHPSLKKRKEILHGFTKTNSSWKLRMALVCLLFSLSAIILTFFVILLINHPTTGMGIFVFLCAGLVLACVPYFLGLGIKNKSKYKCAYPYSSYANGTLILSDQDLQYIFWQVGPTEPAAYSSPRAVFHDEDKFIYNIKREDIRDFQISDIGICSIIGDGQLTLPEDIEISENELKEVSNNFSFALAFDENNVEDVIREWRNNNGN